MKLIWLNFLCWLILVIIYLIIFIWVLIFGFYVVVDRIEVCYVEIGCKMVEIGDWIIF